MGEGPCRRFWRRLPCGVTVSQAGARPCKRFFKNAGGFGAAENHVRTTKNHVRFKKNTCEPAVPQSGSHVVLNGSHVVLSGAHVVLNGSHVVLSGPHVVLSGSHVVLGQQWTARGFLGNACVFYGKDTTRRKSCTRANGCAASFAAVSGSAASVAATRKVSLMCCPTPRARGFKLHGSAASATKEFRRVRPPRAEKPPNNQSVGAFPLTMTHTATNTPATLTSTRRGDAYASAPLPATGRRRPSLPLPR